jgi:hypothetical protein
LRVVAVRVVGASRGGAQTGSLRERARAGVCYVYYQGWVSAFRSANWPARVGLTRCSAGEGSDPRSQRRRWMTGRTLLRVARRLGRDHPRILREKATDSVDLDFYTIRLEPGAENPAAQACIDCSFGSDHACAAVRCKSVVLPVLLVAWIGQPVVQVGGSLEERVVARAVIGRPPPQGLRAARAEARSFPMPVPAAAGTPRPVARFSSLAGSPSSENAAAAGSRHCPRLRRWCANPANGASAGWCCGPQPDRRRS